MKAYFKIKFSCCLNLLGLLYQKYHTLGDLNNKYLYFTVQEAGKSSINVLADLVPGENPLLGL